LLHLLLLKQGLLFLRRAVVLQIGTVSSSPMLLVVSVFVAGMPTYWQQCSPPSLGLVAFDDMRDAVIVVVPAKWIVIACSRALSFLLIRVFFFGRPPIFSLWRMPH
jgi:hypothetical protein